MPISQLGERVEVKTWTNGWGTTKSVSHTAALDGFAVIIIHGKDNSWTYLNLECQDSNDELLGAVTWAYSAQQDFQKSVSVTVPVKAGVFKVVANGQRNDSLLSGSIYYYPLIPGTSG